MSSLMDLVAGSQREILLAISVEDWDGFDDPGQGVHCLDHPVE